MCKSADLLLMVLDASKPHAHRQILTQELESVGIRLNRPPPAISFKKKKTGGVSFNSMGPLTKMDDKLCFRILHVRRCFAATRLCVEDCVPDCQDAVPCMIGHLMLLESF